MPEQTNYDRGGFLRTASASFAAAQLAMSGIANAQVSEPHASFPSIKQINAGLLNIGYAEVGPADGKPVLLLHGWPYDIHSFADVAPLLAAQGYRVIVPYMRGFGSTTFLSSSTFRNCQQSVCALDVTALMDALKIKRAIIAAFDLGARSADIVAALWPERCKGLVSVSGYLIGTPARNKLPSPPPFEHAFWYQYYFATETGLAGYAKNLVAFNKYIWQLSSPKWSFSAATYERTAAAFNNPDHVAIIIHNYRWRIGVAKGEAKYDDLEKRLAALPTISVPTITMEGDANGAAHAPPAAYRARFTGKYDQRTLTGGIGHNLPQEAPKPFAQAVVDVDQGE
ncbi:MAG TPA: alpha/beta hydrolase [Candidatus Cybelea sp.]|jgi:pimeloyl-ACP methyl ester carboxylesterase